MKAFPEFIDMPAEFWAFVRFVSEMLGYTDRKCGTVRTYSEDQIKKLCREKDIFVFDKLLWQAIRYFNLRADLLNNFAENMLMDSKQARSEVSVKPSPAKTNRQAPTSLPVCLIIIIVFFGKIHPFPKCSLAFSVALVQQQIAVWIIKLFRLLPLLEKCGFYNLKYPTVEIFARCGTICFYAVQDKISKEIFLVRRITVF